MLLILERKGCKLRSLGWVHIARNQHVQFGVANIKKNFGRNKI